MTDAENQVLPSRVDQRGLLRSFVKSAVIGGAALMLVAAPTRANAAVKVAPGSPTKKSTPAIVAQTPDKKTQLSETVALPSLGPLGVGITAISLAVVGARYVVLKIRQQR